MKFDDLREELRNYYSEDSFQIAEKKLKIGTDILDSMYMDGMSSYEMKRMQYNVIADIIDPVLFENSPFYYETGVVPGYSDGARNFRGYKNIGGWTYERNRHEFTDQDKETMELSVRQRSELFYLICGEYNDTSQHFLLYFRTIFDKGLKGIYEKAQNDMNSCTEPGEKEFLNSVCDGLLCVKKISEKFAEKATELLKKNPENKNFARIADSARHCPWEKPRNFYEALNTYAFMRKIIGSLEGIGPNSFGRIDVDLLPFYVADKANGSLTDDETYELISRFLITFDSHYDHNMEMVGYADHELENTYVLGGCDADGEPIFNELTKMFLKATDEHNIIFPKIVCRFSKKSPKEYLDLINKPIINGKTTILYQNDDSSIPAFLRGGATLEEARDYIGSGCWDTRLNGCDAADAGGYVNILKVFEHQIHNYKMQKIGMNFMPIDDAESFEEVYKITCDNINVLFDEKLRITTKCGQIWEKVDPVPVYSSMFPDCMNSKKDFTNHGFKYNDDVYFCVGFPNIIDSLLVIKKLCFDKKICTLKHLLNAVRSNWKGYENVREDAIRCPGWGDGSDESNALAKRFNTDLYNMLSAKTGMYGGKIRLGHLTYTEIRFWGEQTRATPDGRYDGDYFSQGLTPSRLKKIPSVTSVINSMAALDKTELAGNTVVNIILPENTPLDICEGFIRASAETSLGSLQLNCVSKETLLDAQKHPEKYPELIVRVCGFSAKFTSLSREWQDEVITRNFYE